MVGVTKAGKAQFWAEPAPSNNPAEERQELPAEALHPACKRRCRGRWQLSGRSEAPTSPASVGGVGGVSTSTGGAPNTGGVVGHGGVNGTGGAVQGGAINTGGSNGSGGTGARNTGGSAQGTSLGGAIVTGGTLSVGGGASTGGTAVGGLGGGTGGSALVQAYDGARGKSFDSGWKFYLGNASGAEQPTFNDTSWRSLSVPHDWSIELSFNKNSPSGNGGGLLDGGIGWYRKTFTLDQSYSGQQIRIEFDGVYMNSQVWINGTSLGTRPYGYSTFQYDLTKYVKTDGSNNVIAVKVDNSSQPNSRWYSGSGIYRNVWLTALNPVHVAYNGGFITTPSVSATSATVSIATDVENQASSSQSVTITTGIYDASGAMVANNTTAASSVAAGATSTLNQSLTVSNPHLWSTDAPYLYQVKLTLQVGNSTVDTYLVPLGLRFYNFDSSKGFSLNGQSMKLWGMAMHHDLGALGAAYHYRALERQLQILKGMGVNAVRTSHNPPVPELLDLADQMGLLIMDEAFDVWETGKNGLNDYHLYFTQWAQTDIQDFVRRDRNHASVIMWSIGNEIQGASTATATNLIKWVKAIDSTRPVTWACNNMGNATNQAVAALLDLQGYNYLQNGSVTSPIFDGDHTSHPTWKIFGSEMESGGRSRGFYSTCRRQSREAGAAATTRPWSAPTTPIPMPAPQATSRCMSSKSIALGSPGSSTGPASTTGASHGHSPAMPRAPISASSTPPASPRTATTSGRAAIRPRPWSTSSRIGTGRPERR